jgi:hypothetical protein
MFLGWNEIQEKVRLERRLLIQTMREVAWYLVLQQQV